uniref:Uncharacterized protein n=1 Tax=Anguilla anguilla TaxID=7936 RepID=A0A0E9WK04_ANGAN
MDLLKRLCLNINHTCCFQVCDKKACMKFKLMYSDCCYLKHVTLYHVNPIY